MKLVHADYKDLSTKNKILAFIICFAVYFIADYVFGNLLLAYSTGRLLPARAIAVLAGIFYGWVGALACAFASLCCYFISEVSFILDDYTSVIYFLFSAAGTFVLAYVSHIIWHLFGKKETRTYSLDSYRRVVRYTITVIIASLATSLFSYLCDSIYFSDYDHYFGYQVFIFCVCVDMGMMIGLPAMVLLSHNLYKDPVEEKSKYSTTEQIVLVFFFIELALFLFCILRVFIGDTSEFAGDISYTLYMSYQQATTLENILILIMLCLIISASKKVGLLKGTEKVIVALNFALIIVGIVVVVKNDLFTVSKAGSINFALIIFDALFSEVLLLAFMLDKHMINRQSILFYIVVVAHICNMVPYAAQSIYLGFGGNEAMVDLYYLCSDLLEAFYLIVSIAFLSESLKVDFMKIKVFSIVTRICGLAYLIGAFGGFFIPQLEFVTYVAWWIVVAEAIIFICLNSKDRFEIVSGIALVALGTLFEVSELFISGYIVSTIGDFLGILLCFAAIYVKGSNALSDTEKDLDFAFTVQQSMLPKEFKIPEFENIDLFASMRPAKEVGGDFYDFYKISKKHLAFVVADVSGKGTPGAMMMMRAITAIKNYAKAGLSVDKLMEMASRNINDHNIEMLFVTAWMGMLNVENGKLRFVNAGHNPPIIRHADGSTEEIKTDPDLVMGFFPDVKYKKHSMFLEPGDTIVLYTDGFNEAYNDNNEQFGMDRLHQAVEQELSTSKEVCEKAVEAVDAFVGNADQFDDMTMMAVKYLGPNNHIFSEGIEDIFGTKRPGSNNDQASSVDLNEERFEKISFVEESIDADSIEIEIINPEASFTDFSSNKETSFEDLLKSSSEIILDGEEHSSAEINLDELTKLSSAIEIEEVASALPIEIEEVGSAIPIEIEEVGSAIPIEIEEVGSAIPIEIEEVGSAIPIEIEEVAGALPIELEEISTIDEYSAAPIEIQRDDMIRFSGHASEALEHMINANQEPKSVVIFKYADEIREYAAKAVRNNVDYLTELMDGYLDELGCPTEVKMKMDISFDEIFSNVANYAYGDGEGDCTIRIQKTLDPLGVSLTIIDKGIPYNPLEKADPDPSRTIESRTLGGAGIFMVKKYMSDVKYEYAGGENRLTLIKLF